MGAELARGPIPRRKKNDVPPPLVAIVFGGSPPWEAVYNVDYK